MPASLKKAKSVGPCQTAGTAQADMGRNFSQMHYDISPLLTRPVRVAQW